MKENGLAKIEFVEKNIHLPQCDTSQVQESATKMHPLLRVLIAIFQKGRGFLALECKDTVFLLFSNLDNIFHDLRNLIFIERKKSHFSVIYAYSSRIFFPSFFSPHQKKLLQSQSFQIRCKIQKKFCFLGRSTNEYGNESNAFVPK